MLAGIFFILMALFAQESPCTEQYLEQAIQRGGTIALACPEPIELTSGKTITRDTFIIGMGNRPLVLDGTNSVGTIFYVTNGAHFSLSHVNVVDSRNFGVLLEENTTLTVTDSRFSYHGDERNNGAGIWNDGGTVSVDGSVFEFNQNGAAVINEGTLEITNSVFRDNADAPALENKGTVLIVGSSFYNEATVANLEGEMTLVDSWIHDNKTGIVNQGELHIGHSRIMDNATGIQNEGTVYFSLSSIFNDTVNCTGQGEFIDHEGNLQGDDFSCGDTIAMTDELPYESYLVTSFSVSDVTRAEDDTYTISLYWASYEVDNFRVVVEPLNWNASRMITLNVQGGAEVYESALVSGLDCGTEYTVYVEGLSADERVVRGRSYKISVLTPGCG